jgi:DnaJ-domain-containing protein 1
MDNFALLSQPRQPWIDLETLKARFLELSAGAHPDRVHAAGADERAAATRRFAALNGAYNCLREPKDRLGHLLELELGAAPANVQNIPPGAMDLFAQIGQQCREADRMIAAKAGSASPLLQAQWFTQGLDLTENLNALQERIRLQREELLAELQGMNAAWNSCSPPGSVGRAAALPLGRLEEIYRILSYITRWSAQLQERVAQLSF